jgi:hypothetical protein
MVETTVYDTTMITGFHVKMRAPEVGDRVAIPGHAVVFIVTSVDPSKKTVAAKMAMTPERIEEDIPWKILTLIDP